MSTTSKKLIDILDEMNLKEDTVNKMVIDKLEKLAKLIFDVNKINITDTDLTFVSTIIEDLIESPHHRITKIEIKQCNKLYRKYNK